MLTFTQPTYEDTADKEWLVTNGIGGYASATICGANTRRYHGLLVAALNPPTQRQVQLLKMEAALQTEDTLYELSTNRYPGVIHPAGYRYLTSFRRNPLPQVSYQAAEHQLTRSIFMVNGSNTTVLEYENTGGTTYQLRLIPLFVDRDYHALFSEDEDFNYYYLQDEQSLTIYSRYGAPPLYLKFSRGDFNEERYWYKNLEYEKEQYRGLDYQEDAYAIGQINCQLSAGEKLWIVCTLDADQLDADPVELKAAELSRLRKLDPGKHASAFYRDLATAADQFIVKRASTDSYSILAGYHWFTDWGRDTMIALRGLGITLGRQRVSRSILSTFLKYLSKGMLPNRFPDHEGEEVEYNTIDATLWLFVALYDYHQRFGDHDFISKELPSLSRILEAHLAGTRYDIQVTEEGFLYGGQEGMQLTWMDARVDGVVVTPRSGCAVEIQALWYNALRVYLYFIETVAQADRSKLSEKCRELCAKLEGHFLRRFFNETGYLNDVYHPDGDADDTLRPNQLFALSLPFTLVDHDRRNSILKVVTEKLYTPYGLRTLPPDHADFKPVYQGGPWERDHAYHQGTIWPFLLETYWMAYLQHHGFSQASITYMRSELHVLQEHFYRRDGIHCISEIFDGAEPGAGRGTIQQAWSVSAVLRLLHVTPSA